MEGDNTSEPSRTDESLSADEREAIGCALEEGYFEDPRRATLLDLADALGTPDVEVSRLLRSGVATVLRENSF